MTDQIVFQVKYCNFANIHVSRGYAWCTRDEMPDRSRGRASRWNKWRGNDHQVISVRQNRGFGTFIDPTSASTFRVRRVYRFLSSDNHISRPVIDHGAS